MLGIGWCSSSVFIYFCLVHKGVVGGGRDIDEQRNNMEVRDEKESKGYWDRERLEVHKEISF